MLSLRTPTDSLPGGSSIKSNTKKNNAWYFAWHQTIDSELRFHENTWLLCTKVSRSHCEIHVILETSLYYGSFHWFTVTDVPFPDLEQQNKPSSWKSFKNSFLRLRIMFQWTSSKGNVLLNFDIYDLWYVWSLIFLLIESVVSVTVIILFTTIYASEYIHRN